MDYGLDVTWKAGETLAFLEFNRLCREQALAAFADRVAGREPIIVPALDLAARARATAAA